VVLQTAGLKVAFPPPHTLRNLDSLAAAAGCFTPAMLAVMFVGVEMIALT
jgi:hypothetical protein